MPGWCLLELEIAICDMNLCISRAEAFLGMQGPAIFYFFFFTSCLMQDVASGGSIPAPPPF